MFWNNVNYRKGVKFTHVGGNMHHGISNEGLNCYIRKGQFMGNGATGYVAIPLSMCFESDLDKMFKIFNSKVYTHGGITYSETNLGGFIKDSENMIVLGFDTMHSESPRCANAKFMIDEVLKLSRCAYSVSQNKELEPKFKIENKDKDKNSDYFSKVLQLIDIEGRKLPLPKEENYTDPIAYIMEVLDRIENGYEKEHEEM